MALVVPESEIITFGKTVSRPRNKPIITTITRLQQLPICVAESSVPVGAMVSCSTSTACGLSAVGGCNVLSSAKDICRNRKLRQIQRVESTTPQRYTLTQRPRGCVEHAAGISNVHQIDYRRRLKSASKNIVRSKRGS